ncbi:MAG TPA: hypothetical protein VF669_18565 [Tepidisphaeraceae bacterium]|jgi:hypothetical protein
MRKLIAAVVLLAALAPASAQNSSALINEALDKQVRLNIVAKTPLPQIMKQIATDTGVRIEASPDVWELLPWGESTAIAATIENQTLRQALEAITRKLGLTFVLQDEAVQLQPMAPLKRIGRRATLSELDVLDLLATNQLGTTEPQLTVRQLLGLVDNKLESLKSPFAVENRVSIEQALAVPRNATMLDAMEAITKNTAVTWYPWGRTLVVVPKEEPIRNQLGKTINARFQDADISQVLNELSSRSGVAFSIEPGAIQRIPMESRKVQLILNPATIQQALESLAGFTGLSYSVNDKGVYIWNESKGTGSSNREPTYGLLTLDNGMQVLIPQSQVPADLRDYLKHKTQQHFDKIRQMMKEEGYKAPATQPAPSTKPVNENL